MPAATLPAVAHPIALSPELLTLLRRHDLLRPLVRKLVVAEAVAGVTLTPEQQGALMAAFRRERHLEEEQTFAAFLEERSLSPEDLLWQLELPLRLHQHVRENYLAKAENRFLARKSALDSVVYSLLRVKDPFLARELYIRIADGEASFADLAALHAEGHEKQSRGIVGPKPLGSAHPLLAEKLRLAEPGQLIEPFPVEQWWVLARVEHYEPARFDEPMADRMASELFEEWVEENTARKVRSLLSAAESAPGLPSP